MFRPATRASPCLTSLGNSLAWALLLVLPVSSSLADAGMATLRFAPEQHYPPFVFQDDDGQIRGLSMDVLQELQRRSGVTIETLPPQPLQQILQAARDGQVDLVSSLRPDAERARYLNFSRPYVSVPAMLITRPDSTHSQIRDLAGRSVAVGAGFGVSTFLTARFPTITQIPVPDDQAALALLAEGRVEAAVMDLASYRHLASSQPDAFAIRSAVGYSYSLGFAWRHEADHAGRTLDAALAKVPPATLQAIRARWLGRDFDPLVHAAGQRVKQVAWGLLAAGLLLLVLVRLIYLPRPASS